MVCLCFKKEKKETTCAWLIERRKIRMYNSRISAIVDELEDYQHLIQNKSQTFSDHPRVALYHKHIIRVW